MSPTYDHPEFDVGQRVPSASGTYYRILQRLGAGGNSHVYLVEALTGSFKGVLFALKMFVKVNDATRLGRFQQEVDFLQKLDHPSIMRVYDNGKYIVSSSSGNSTFPFVIAEFLPKTLHDEMRSGITMMEKLVYTLQLLSGLALLSSSNPQVVHRDIKPQNIFVRGKSCILGDFGLMKFLVDESCKEGEATEEDPSFIIESVGPRLPRFYRTPDLVEYCKNKSVLTVKSDVFQLGLVLAEMFTGENPLRPAKKILDEVVLDPILPVAGSQGDAIYAQIKQMLMLSVEERPYAQDLFDKWEGAFLEALKVSHQLEGKIF